MSNFLAIATVTATLRRTLGPIVDDDVAGAKATSVRPGSGTPEIGVNLYLYQVTPNAAWRNADLPNRASGGEVVQRPRAALDLHYLLSFYGDQGELAPERLLGSVVRTLHAQPILTRQMIRETVGSPDFPLLANSDLAEEVELVKFTPLSLSLEDLSKLWSVFFQTPYTLSVAYLATVVLIESDNTPREALPVRERTMYVAPFREPVITEVLPRLIGAGGKLTIHGRNLMGDIVKVVFGTGPPIDPETVLDAQIEITLPADLPAGIHPVQIVHQLELGIPQEPHRGFDSNVAVFVLQPRLTAAPSLSAPGPTVTLQVAPDIAPRQDVTLLLNETPVPAGRAPQAYSFSIRSGDAPTNTIDFIVPGVQPATYLVRARVDRAESSLDLDPASPNFGPTVTFP